MKAIQKFINEDGLWIRYESGDPWNYFQIGEMKDYIEIGRPDAETLINELADWIAGEKDSGSTQEENKEVNVGNEIPF